MPQSEYVQVNCQPLPAISDTGFQVDLKKQVSLIPYFHRGMAIICGLLIAVDLMLGQLTRLRGMSGQLLKIAPGILLLLLITIYCIRRGYGKMAEITLLSAWAALHTNILSFVIQAAGRVPVPMIDAQLGQVDRAMGFSTAGIVQWMAQFPLCRDALAKSYDLITPLILVAIFVPVLFGHATSARRYALSVLIAGGITALLFTFLPAVGPWSVQGYTPAYDQGAVEAYHRLLRTSRSMQINQEVAGVVTFPSFHVVLAVLTVPALWPIRGLRVAAVAMAALVTISTITTGWHYGIDVLGGLAVSFVAYHLAKAAGYRLEA